MGFRFPLASILLLGASFIFFVIWAVMSFLLGMLHDFFLPLAQNISDPTSAAMASNEIGMLNIAFGIICLTLFVAGILAFYFFDVFKEEQDVYYYEE